jgi:polar amino acid transport system permease protein
MKVVVHPSRPTVVFAVFALCTTLVSSVVLSQPSAHSAVLDRGIPATLVRWLPAILLGPKDELGGFALDIIVSFLAMGIGTLLGLLLGIAQISLSRSVRTVAWAITQFFRNSPWLVLLFFVIMLVPFKIQIGTTVVPFPAWIKATLGLALPIMGNVSEIVRGAINSIPKGQWEAATSLGLTRNHVLWLVILPQCVKRMLPPWMNWYAILTMATPLVSIVGVNDAMTMTQDALAAEARSELLIPMYLMLLVLFFCYCYPIARLTLYLERKFALVH